MIALYIDVLSTTDDYGIVINPIYNAGRRRKDMYPPSTCTDHTASCKLKEHFD